MPHRSRPSRGLALLVLRLGHGWGQQDLADAAGLSKHQLVSDYETGQRPLSLARFHKLAEVMGHSASLVDALVRMIELCRAAGRPRIGSEVETASWEVAAAVTAVTEQGLTPRDQRWIAAQAKLAREEAARQWQVLRGCAPADRRVLVEDADEYQSWALAEACCHESVRAAADSADRALELANLALRIAELVPGPAKWRSRLLGYSWAHVGNARRVKGELTKADEAFRHAVRLWNEGAAGDVGLLDEVRVLHMEASLRIERGLLRESLVLLDRALASRPGSKELGGLLVNKARALGFLGEFEAAIATLREIPPESLKAGGVRSRWLQRFNLMVNLIGLARFDEAERLLPEVRALAAEVNTDLDPIRVRWQEAEILAGLGRRQEAIVAFSRVRQEFVERELPYDGALATLELARLYCHDDRIAEAKRLLREVAPVLEAQGIQQDVVMALRLCCQTTFRSEMISQQLLLVLKYLKRAQHDPAAAFSWRKAPEEGPP